MRDANWTSLPSGTRTVTLFVLGLYPPNLRLKLTNVDDAHATWRFKIRPLQCTTTKKETDTRIWQHQLQIMSLLQGTIILNGNAWRRNTILKGTLWNTLTDITTFDQKRVRMYRYHYQSRPKSRRTRNKFRTGMDCRQIHPPAPSRAASATYKWTRKLKLIQDRAGRTEIRAQ